MKESIAGRERRGLSRSHPEKDAETSKSIKDGAEDQLSIINDVVQRSRCDGCRPSMSSMAAQLSAMNPAARRSAALSLQSSHGNRFLQGLAVQAKAVQKPSTSAAQTGILQRSAAGSAPETVPPIVHEVLRSPGQTLDPSIRSFMEPRFGQDFGQVRVHTDAKAAESAQAVNALAYTVGQDIVFKSGKYLPKSSEGQSLLAHELTHVVQQGANKSGLQLAGKSDDDYYEHEANYVAQQVMQTTRPILVGHVSRSAAVLRRQSEGTVSSPQPNIAIKRKISEDLKAEAKADAQKIKSILENPNWLGHIEDPSIMAIVEKWANKPIEAGAGDGQTSFDHFLAAIQTMTYLKKGWVVDQSTSLFNEMFDKMDSDNTDRFKKWMQTRAGRGFKNDKPNKSAKFEIPKEDIIRGVKAGGELAIAVGTGGGSLLAKVGLWLATELPTLYNQAEIILDAISAIRGTKSDNITNLISSSGLGKLLVSVLFGEVHSLPAPAKGEETEEKELESREVQGEKGLIGLLHNLIKVFRAVTKTYGQIAEFINKGLSLVNITRYSWFKPFSMAYAAIINAQKAMESPGSAMNQATAELRNIVENFFGGLQTRIKGMAGEIKSRVGLLGEPSGILRNLADRAIEWVLNLLITKGPSDVIKTIFEIYQIASGKSIMEQLRKIPLADKLIKNIADSDTIKKILQPLEPPIRRLVDAVDQVSNKGNELISGVENQALSLMRSGTHLVEELAGVALDSAKGTELKATSEEREGQKGAISPALSDSSSDFLGIMKQGIHSRLLAIGERNLLEKSKAILEKGVTAGKGFAKKVTGILLGSKIDFDILGEHHQLWAEVQDEEVTVFIESYKESMERKIQKHERAVSNLQDLQTKKKSIDLINQLKNLNLKVKSLAKKDAKNIKKHELDMKSVLEQLENLMGGRAVWGEQPFERGYGIEDAIGKKFKREDGIRRMPYAFPTIDFVSGVQPKNVTVQRGVKGEWQGEIISNVTAISLKSFDLRGKIQEKEEVFKHIKRWIHPLIKFNGDTRKGITINSLNGKTLIVEIGPGSPTIAQTDGMNDATNFGAQNGVNVKFENF